MSGPQQARLDQGSTDLINQGTARANEGVDAFADRTNENAGERASSIGSLDQPADAHGAASGQDPAYLKAIRNAYSGQATAGIDNLKNQNTLQARFQKSDDLRRMAQIAIGHQQAMNASYGAMTQAYVQNEQARAQAVSQVFGLAQTAIGMNAAGGKQGQQGETINQAFGSPRKIGNFAQSE